MLLFDRGFLIPVMNIKMFGGTSSQCENICSSHCSFISHGAKGDSLRLSFSSVQDLKSNCCARLQRLSSDAYLSVRGLEGEPGAFNLNATLSACETGIITA